MGGEPQAEGGRGEEERMSPLWLGWLDSEAAGAQASMPGPQPRDSIVLALEPRLPDGGLGSLSGGIPARSPGLQQGWS